MTLNEFKAWFEGFTEMMEGAPTEKQWRRIKARVVDISNDVVKLPVYRNGIPSVQNPRTTWAMAEAGKAEYQEILS